MVASTGTIIVNFDAPHRTANNEVPYLRADWKKVFGILLESLSAERTGYSGDVRGANLNWVHYPENTERFGANGTTGDKLMGHVRLLTDAQDFSALPDEIRKGRWEWPALAE